MSHHLYTKGQGGRERRRRGLAPQRHLTMLICGANRNLVSLIFQPAPSLFSISLPSSSVKLTLVCPISSSTSFSSPNLGERDALDRQCGPQSNSNERYVTPAQGEGSRGCVRRSGLISSYLRGLSPPSLSLSHLCIGVFKDRFSNIGD